MTIAELQRLIGAKKFAPVYLIYGEEDYLVEESSTLIVNAALGTSERSFNYSQIDGKNSSGGEVVATASSFPMMGDRKVVVVNDFNELTFTEEEKELFARYIEKPLQSTVLILIAPTVDFRRKLYLDCKKYAEVIECKKLKPNQIFEWIEDVLKESKKYIESAAMELLIASVGESLNALKNELDKLVNFIGEKNTITIDNVSEIVGIAKEFTIFELIKALGEKDVQRSLMILNRMLELGESPQGMIVMITRFYTQLWRLDELRRQHRSDNEIATEIGVPPYYLKQTYEYFSNYKIVEIEANLRALLTAEVEMKTKSTEPRIVMELLIQSLIEDGARVEQVLGSPFER